MLPNPNVAKEKTAVWKHGQVFNEDVVKLENACHQSTSTGSMVR